MKIVVLLLSLLFVASACRKEEGVWDELTDDERAYLRQQATTKCLNETQKKFDYYKEDASELFSSHRFQRNDSWLYELKNGTTPDVTYEIRVWKQTSSATYFYVRQIFGSSNKDTFFLKVDTAINDAMIDNLHEKGCDNDENFKVTGGDGGPQTVTLKYKRAASTNYEEVTDTIVHSHQYPPIFGLFNLSRVIVEKKTEDDTTVSTTKLTKTFKDWTDQDDLLTTINSYVNETTGALKLCIPLQNGGGSYTLPYTFNCNNPYNPAELQL